MKQLLAIQSKTAAAALLVTAACFIVSAPTGPAAAAATGAERGLLLFFVPDIGNATAEAGYILRAPHFSAHFTASATQLQSRGASVTVRFGGASGQARLEALGPLPGRVNYLLGNRPEEWRTDLPTYAALACRGLYSRVDLHYGVVEGRLKSEFRVAAGGDPGVIRWRYEGAVRTYVDNRGALVIETTSGEMRDERPELFQEVAGRRLAVQGGYRDLGDGWFGFAAGPHDCSKELVIDPIVSYSTYLGGAGQDSARAITTDASGYAYVTGYTDSTDLPAAIPYQGGNGGSVDVFVAKLNAAGNALIYCTYLGGNLDDRAYALAIDASANIYVAGWTYSANFPTTSTSFQRVLAGGRDAFVTKLSSNGSRLVYSTYLGGTDNEAAYGLGLDSSGSAYLAGETHSTNFPLRGAYQAVNRGRQEAFVAKLSPDGASLDWSTYLGGSGDDKVNSLALDSSGNVYVAGGTTSTNFPTVLPLQSTNAGGQDAFVTKISAGGSTLSYSTYLGGSGGTTTANEAASGIQVDQAGTAYVVGTTPSSNFPTLNAYQSSLGGSLDAFVTHLNAAGNALVYSTYLGGAGIDYACAASLASSGVLAVAGYTISSDFPTTSGLQTSRAGGYDAFLTRIAPTGAILELSTYWGGTGNEAIYAVKMDQAGTMWFAGQTLSLDHPVKNSIQNFNAGGLDAIVAKMGDSVPVAAFRSYNGNPRVTVYGSSVMHNPGGYITSDPAIWQSPTGSVYVAGGNTTSCMYMNVLDLATLTWAGWVQAGCSMYGNPAIVALASGEAYLITRDYSYNYWINRYIPASGFQGWASLGGGLATDPVAALATDGSIYVVGRKTSGAVYCGRYVPGSGFQGWSTGGANAPAAQGTPAIVGGSKGAAYIAVRATDNTTWIVRLSGSSWGTWYSAGGNALTDPGLAAAAGKIYVSLTDTYSAVYVKPFIEGSSNGWQPWLQLNGHLMRASISAVGTRYFVVGRGMNNDLWWYESGVGWTSYGYPGLAAGHLWASPK
jgi:hypothetical protein